MPDIIPVLHPELYGDPNFKGFPPTQYRNIVFNGVNSLIDMGLVINGQSPLSALTPKIVTKDIPFADGAIDLSRVDGKLHFNQREIVYDFLFIAEKENHNSKTQDVTDYMNNAINTVYNWLLGASNIDLYDSAYKYYKFTNASVTNIEPKKTIVGESFVTVLTVTFKVDPWIVSIAGTRIDFAQFVDRTRLSTGQQSVCHFYDNNKFWLNDNVGHIETYKVGPHHYKATIRPTKYQGKIGLSLQKNYWYGGIQEGDHVGIDHVTVGNEDTHYMGSVPPTIPGEDDTYYIHAPYVYYWANIGTRPAELDIYTTEESVDDYWNNTDHKWTMEFYWGIITDYSLPDENHYHFDVYTRANTVRMELNEVTMSDYTTFTLEDQTINVIEIFNDTFDGYYKLYYDSTTRRMM
jgi:hypothetical protein